MGTICKCRMRSRLILPQMRYQTCGRVLDGCQCTHGTVIGTKRILLKREEAMDMLKLLVTGVLFESINRVPVGAEIGMVNQGIDTFYPFHNHAIPEIYYTIRKPKCLNEFNNFAIRENNPLLKTLSETDHMREVQFDGSHEDADHFWVPTSPKVDDLIYFHENTIHAFEINGEDCHDEPEEKAIVTVWARSMAHDRRNDYGTTLLCESDAEPETPAMKDDLWRCDLTKTKWRRSARSVHNPFEFNHH